MGSKQSGFDYLMRLLNACKERGITVLLANQISGDSDRMEISGNGISSLVDTVLLLTYKQELGETNRVIQVIKHRGSAHSNQEHEYRITDQGIEIMGLYVGRGQALTGSARLLQEALGIAEAQRLDNEIASKEQELKQLRLLQQQAQRGNIARDAVRRGTAASEMPKASEE